MQINKRRVLDFMKSGKAVLTVKNSLTGNHKTFLITQTEDRDAWFINIRGDKDRSKKYMSRKNWIYVGLLTQDMRFFTTRGSKVNSSSQAFKSFAWLCNAARHWERGDDNYPNIEVFHCGYCGRCGRPLTDPESIENGFGPECIKKVVGGS